MKEKEKDVKRLNEMRISCERAQTEPKYKATAAGLLEACREFYRDQANEKAYLDSMKQKGCGSE